MKVLFFATLFIIFSAFLFFPNFASAGISEQGSMCMSCPKKDGQKAFLIWDGFANKCSYAFEGTDCDGKSCYIDGSRVDPTIEGNNGVCPSNTTCDANVYKGCVTSGTEEELSCQTSVTTCSFSSTCRPENSCTKNYCVEYRNGIPFEVTNDYSLATGRKGVCEQLNTPPQVVSASENGYYVKDNATTIVGAGTSIGGSVALPPKPTKDVFLDYFEVYKCTNSSLASLLDCTKAADNSAETNFAYDIYSDPLRAPKYRNLLNIDAFGKIRVYLKPPGDGNPNSVCDFSGGGNYDNITIRLSGYMQPACSKDDMKWSMIHESAHIIQRRNQSFFKSFNVEQLAQKDGKTNNADDCYDTGVDGPYIQTYRYRAPAGGCQPGKLDCGGGSKAESFGEAVGMNVVCGPNKKCEKATDLAAQPITNYPQKCSNTYDWVRDNVFGGIDFFGLGGSSDESGFQFYCQGDPRWDMGKPLAQCTLRNNGCVPTATAMILTTLGKNLTPPQIVDSWLKFGIPQSNSGCSAGTVLTDIINAGWFDRQGFKTSPNLTTNGNLNMEAAAEYINGSKEWFIIAGVEEFPCVRNITRCALGHTSSKHEFVITDVDPAKNTITIRDPMGCTMGGKETRYDRTRNPNFGGDYFHAYAIRRK